MTGDWWDTVSGTMPMSVRFTVDFHTMVGSWGWVGSAHAMPSRAYNAVALYHNILTK